jgi:FMN phosphatase YigB (HAD superfamily)
MFEGGKGFYLCLILMKVVLFDLGHTLEANGVLVPNASETLNTIRTLKDKDGNSLLLGLVSDYKVASTTQDIDVFLKEYYAILDQLKIRSFFEPVSIHVTLSTEVGVRKPNEQIFRKAVDKFNVTPKILFKNAAFITEDATHIAAVRQFGMKGICVKGGPNPTSWDVDTLPEILPLLDTWLKN